MRAWMTVMRRRTASVVQMEGEQELHGKGNLAWQGRHGGLENKPGVGRGARGTERCAGGGPELELWLLGPRESELHMADTGRPWTARLVNGSRQPRWPRHPQAPRQVPRHSPLEEVGCRLGGLQRRAEIQGGGDKGGKGRGYRALKTGHVQLTPGGGACDGRKG